MTVLNRLIALKSVVVLGFMSAYFLFLIMMLSWHGLEVLVISFFYWGLPALVFGFPLFGLFLLAKRKKLVHFGFLSSMTGAAYLVRIAAYYPIEIDFVSPVDKPLPSLQVTGIVLAIITYLLMAFLLYLVRLGEFNNAEKKN